MRPIRLCVVPVLLAAVGGCAAFEIPEAAPGGARRTQVAVPRAWPDAVEALIAAHRQTGLRYAVVPPTFRGVIGPYEPGQAIGVDRLIAAVAEATGTTARRADGVAVFDPRPPDAAELPTEPRERVLHLARDGRSSTIPELSRLVAHADRSVGLQALAALYRLEGDYMRRAWPGRVSIFEVLRGRLDRQALLWALTDGHRRASPGWRMALHVLARSREPYLNRHTWSVVWEKTPGTIRLSLWAMGRAGDQDASRPLSKRVRKSFTNHPADRYLAAMALGELGNERELRRNIRYRGKLLAAPVRRAVVFGLALCPETDSLLAQLDRSLRDRDPVVRFLSCQALGRIGTSRAVARLAAMTRDPKLVPELRCAALDGLTLATSPDAAKAILAAATDPNPVIRAKAAGALGAAGGASAQRPLLGLINDKDRWVRAAAACALGSLGSRPAVGRLTAYLGDKNTDTDGAIAAMIGLGRGHSPRAKSVLGRIALEPRQNDRLRRYAVLALAQLANRAGHATLKKLTLFGSRGYLPFALRHLELETPAETARHVIGFLARGGTATAAAAACRLAELGQGDGVRELLEGSNVFSNHARMMHMWGAIRARGPEAISALVRAAKSQRAGIRAGAALALGGRLDVAAVDALIELTRDRSSGVRSLAAQSLGLCGDPKAVPDLIRLAEKDEAPRVVGAAIRALRLRPFSNHPDVQKLFATLAGTPRDAGVIDPNQPSVRGQPAHSFVLRRWASSLEDRDMCNITYESSLTYDSDRGRVVLWGAHGRRADAPQTGQTWFYGTAGNSWKRLMTSREWPNATCCIWSTAYDPARRVVVLPLSGRGGHGWVNSLRANMQYSIPWVLDTRTDQWYPAKPLRHKGGLNMVSNSFSPQCGLTACWYGRISAYDAHANEWWTMASSRGGPGKVSNGDGAFDPKTGRYLVVGATSTWAFDPAADTWTDLKPAGGNGPPNCQLVYDSANHVLLVFKPQRGVGITVHVYHIDQNRWERLPAVHPSPHYGTFAVAYDARSNVTVIGGGWESGRSGETTVRETWTYRYKPATARPPALGRPRAAAVVTSPGGKARLTWLPPKAGKAAGYRIYRGPGRRAWKVTWQRVAQVKAKDARYDDSGLDPGTPLFYRVTAVDASGKEGPASYPARTEPPAPRWTAAVLTADGVRLEWSPCPGKDVVGYHVYRAPLAARSYWSGAFNPMTLLAKSEPGKPPVDPYSSFRRLTAQPVKGAEWTDGTATVTGAASEITWPGSYVYVVRAVNAWGLEGGRGPATLALPDAPGPVRVIPWLDGRRLVFWLPCRAEQVRGYYVMRMDDWHGKYVFRWHASPLVGYGFYDRRDFPTADRRRYYVSGVDAIGAVGIPSSGAWSHGFP